jgi:hypothetical protein
MRLIEISLKWNLGVGYFWELSDSMTLDGELRQVSCVVMALDTGAAYVIESASLMPVVA